MNWWRLTNEKRKLLQSKKGGAGGVLARTTGRALPNQHPPMVAGWRGLLCRFISGVWIMNRHETLAKISYYEWMLESMKLTVRHELWIRDQIENLLATLPALREREGVK